MKRMAVGVSANDIRVLKTSPVFQGVPEADCLNLLKELHASVMAISQGQLLRRTGDALAFYPVVIEGRVRATMPQGGQDREIAQFAAGDSFAEAVPRTLKHSSVNICAMQPTRVLCIPADELEKCTSSHAFVLQANLSTEMSKKIGLLSQALSVVGEPRLSDCILAYLRNLPVDADGFVTVPMSRQEWAVYLRVADKSLSRELRAMQEAGQLQVDGRRIRLM